jgi:hypothetical protein
LIAQRQPLCSLAYPKFRENSPNKSGKYDKLETAFSGPAALQALRLFRFSGRIGLFICTVLLARSLKCLLFCWG